MRLAFGVRIAVQHLCVVASLHVHKHARALFGKRARLFNVSLQSLRACTTQKGAITGGNGLRLSADMSSRILASSIAPR